MSFFTRVRQALLTQEGVPRWAEPFTRPARWMMVWLQALVRDRAPIQASGMAYTTLVALVPMLLLVWATLDATGMLQANRPAIDALIFESFLGDIPEVREVLLPGLEGASLGTLGIVGVFGLLITAGNLYLLVEYAYSDIFGTRIERPFHVRALMFYAVLTGVPLIFIGSFVQAWDLFGDLGGSYGRRAAMALVQYVALFSAIKVFPATTVRNVPAAWGSLVSLLLLAAVSGLFQLYLQLFAARNPVTIIYGSLGVIPVFLMWLYLAWLAILLGVEVAAVAQNFRSMLEAEYSALHEDLHGRKEPGFDVALLVASAVARCFQAGAGPAHTAVVSRRVGMSERDTGKVLVALSGVGLVAHTEEGWVLARPPEQIHLHDLADHWRDKATPVRVEHDALHAIREELSAGLSGTLADGLARWPDPLSPRVVPDPEPTEDAAGA